MRDGFAPVRPIVNHDAESIVQLFRPRYLARNQKKMSYGLGVTFSGICDSADNFFWNDQGMHGGLWVNVPDRYAYLILVQDFGRNIAFDDFLKDCTHCSFSIEGRVLIRP